MQGAKKQRQKSHGMMEQKFTSGLVVMNEKQMQIADNATAKGIVSLYNKGFVPKKTGKVSKNSKFATTNKTLYNIESEQKEAETDAQDYQGQANQQVINDSN